MDESSDDGSNRLLRTVLVLSGFVILGILIAGSHSLPIQTAFTVLAIVQIFVFFPSLQPFHPFTLLIPIALIAVFIGVVFATRDGLTTVPLGYILAGILLFGWYLVQRRRLNAESSTSNAPNN